MIRSGTCGCPKGTIARITRSLKSVRYINHPYLVPVPKWATDDRQRLRANGSIVAVDEIKNVLDYHQYSAMVREFNEKHTLNPFLTPYFSNLREFNELGH
jgi:hypothetical protein